MGLHPRTYDICKKYFQADKNIAELGAQVIYGDEWEIYPRVYFRDKFKDLNITSIDITGENNSVIINLSLPISDEFIRKFDIVTNFGTSEHVQDQFNCWKNIFNMLVVDGIVISEIPKIGFLPKHCKYYFDENTFKSLEDDFDILEITDRNYNYNDKLIYCVLKKIHDGQFKTTSSKFLNTIYIDQNFIDTQGY